MVDISYESSSDTEERLRRVIKKARLKIYSQSYAFQEFSHDEFPRSVHPGALALIRDDQVWSQLVPCVDQNEDLFSIFRFHFPAHADNSGFVGWLANHFKRNFGTGVFVTCGQNRKDGGIFDYWGVPISVGGDVLQEVARLVAAE
ncbi:hypothetical protein GCM10010985_61420 [Caballeronia grimmiae]|uniref:Uncharacterized protein n=2 Tax=Caballeronia grimmiae TaxID=1071679 RepID=A0ABQ1S8N5_9BURK|nr:hypothetical protein GCM10010985_61420 [Caballeronia grimmiae]